MKLLKKLQNPFVLVGQGFVLGAVLFFATRPDASEAAAPTAEPVASVLNVVHAQL